MLRKTDHFKDIGNEMTKLKVNEITLIKNEAKANINRLVETYKLLKSEGKIRANDEEQIKQHFIELLFEYLGWSMRDPEEVIKEERIGRKKVDFAFKLNGMTKFFIEAKAVNIDLTDKAVVEQALNYGWNAGITWSILSNFERIFILNSEWKTTGNALLSNYKTLYYDKFANEQFEGLWLLSKESFLANRLDLLAEKEERKARKTPVTKQLFKDLTKIRNILRADLIKHNISLKDKPQIIPETIQRIIDKLIFIRKTEDMGIEDYPLKKNLRLYMSGELKHLAKNIQQLFIKFNDTYDSEMFKPEHISNQADISDNAMSEIVSILYSSDERCEYNFAHIDADVLGNIYEQYLALMLKGGEIRGKYEGSKIQKKEQGVYYTPTYIVNYIVKNCVGEWIKENENDVEKIKVLDPACGSGSFLIRTVDFIYKERIKKEGKEYQSKLEDSSKARTTLKSDIITKNIYGVDVDEKAIDIVQLNLLLKAIETKQKLPTLRQNIKVGNSLIDDSGIAHEKAFKWKEQFTNLITEKSEGLFDIVIGNPPYLKARDTKDAIGRKWIEKSGEYETPYKMWDTYVVFVERGVKLLKPNGIFAMIIPDTIGVADYTQKLVDLLITRYSVYQIDFFPDIVIFDGVGVKNKIIFVKNTKAINKCKRILHEGTVENVRIIDVINNRNKNIFKLDISKIDFAFPNTIPLGNICYVSYGARFNSDKSDKMKFKKSDLISDTQDKIHNKIYTEGKYIDSYRINKELFVEWGTERCPKRLVRPTFPELYPPEKLLMSRQKRIVSYTDKGLICDNTIIVGVPYFALKGVENNSIKKYLKNIKLNRVEAEETSLKFNLKYLLTILNSKLVAYFLKLENRSKIDSYPDDWKKIPIKLISEEQQTELASKADKILSLCGKIKDYGSANTDGKERLNNEIKSLEKDIDNLIYKLYGITEKEKRIIEE